MITQSKYLNKIGNKLLLANNNLRTLFKGASNDFRISTGHIEESQKNRLNKIISSNKDCYIGKKFGFNSIKNVKDFQNAVPITEYHFYEPLIDLYNSKNDRILSSEEILLFEMTSGSTSKKKLIPYTVGLKKDFLRGLGAWIYDLYEHNSEITHGKSYWSITPPTQMMEIHKSGINIGFESDEDYFGDKAKKEISAILSVPSQINKITDFEKFRYISQLFLSLSPELSFISIWNPTFLEVLFKNYRQNLPSIIKDIKMRHTRNINLDNVVCKHLLDAINTHPDCVARLEQVMKIKDDKEFYLALFPNIRVISCWTHGNSKLYLDKITDMFPNIKIQSKGLIATEYLASIPIHDAEWPVLVPNSHFFEFAPIEKGKSDLEKIATADKLENNKEYLLIVTTSGGFYRYNTGDIIQVHGFYKQTPMFEFVGKADNICDMVGEKMNAQFVEEIFNELKAKYSLAINFLIIAPQKSNKIIRYVIFIESGDCINKLAEFKREFELRLEESFYYQHAIKLGQLNKLGLFLIEKGAQEAYIGRCNAMGQKFGDIKNSILSKNTDWEGWFSGIFAD